MLRVLFAFAFLLMVRPAFAQCAHDDAVSEAAATLMLSGERDGEAIARALRDAGSDLPHARLKIFGGTDEIGPWLERFDDDAPLACGRASGEGIVLMLVGAKGGSLVPEDAGFRVELAEGFVEPRVAMRDARGRLVRVPVSEGAHVRPPVELVPPIQVQLVASGANGPRPVAVRHLGGTLPEVIIDGEGDLRSRLRALRTAHGVRELRDNRLLVREADRHARSVCRAGRARHALDPRRDPEARLASRGIRARVVGEVVSRAGNEEEAFAALARSADHRMAMVDRRFTDVGVGRSERGGRVCVVVTLAAWPRFVGR